MKAMLFIVSSAILIPGLLLSQTVWKKSTNDTLVFTKVGFADHTLAVNQDRISDSVWMTRASTQSLFNVRKEAAYQTGSPIGTEWAKGTTANYATLAYSNFVTLSGGNPTSLIGKNLVLHLLSENIYLDITITAYGSGGTSGGNFTYSRSTPNPRKPTWVDQSRTPSMPNSFLLHQNYPNPFNPSTVIRYQLPITGHCSLAVYDLLGHHVASLVNEVKEPGDHTVVFNGSTLSSGVYLFTLQAGSFTATKKLILLK